MDSAHSVGRYSSRCCSVGARHAHIRLLSRQYGYWRQSVKGAEGKVTGHPPRGGVRCGDLTRRGGGVGHPIECLLVKCHTAPTRKMWGIPFDVSLCHTPMPNGTHFAMAMDMQSAGQRVQSVPSVGEDTDSLCGALCM